MANTTTHPYTYKTQINASVLCQYMASIRAWLCSDDTRAGDSVQSRNIHGMYTSLFERDPDMDYMINLHCTRNRPYMARGTRRKRTCANQKQITNGIIIMTIFIVIIVVAAAIQIAVDVFPLPSSGIFLTKRLAVSTQGLWHGKMCTSTKNSGM